MPTQTKAHIFFARTDGADSGIHAHGYAKVDTRVCGDRGARLSSYKVSTTISGLSSDIRGDGCTLYFQIMEVLKAPAIAAVSCNVSEMEGACGWKH